MKSLKNGIALLLLLFTLLFDQFVTGIEPIKGVLSICERCDGICNQQFCQISSACRPLNRTSKWRTLNITFHEGVIISAPVEIVAYKKFRTEYRQFMLKLKGEYCHEVAERSHPFLKFFNNRISDGTLFDPCPLQGRRYSEPGATSSRIYIRIPTGEWKLKVKLSKNFNRIKTHILTVNTYFTIKSSTAEEF